MSTYTLTEKQICTHAQKHTEKLNHIISAQIINDIIFGCSLYNVGQLDARGNEEGVRETVKGEQRKMHGETDNREDWRRGKETVEMGR